MNKKVIPPWEKGSTVVQDAVPRTQAEHIKSVAKLGGLATQRNKRLRAQGFKVKSKAQLYEEEKNRPKAKGTAGNPDPKSQTSLRIARKTDENLTDKERERAIKFCHQYIKDFNVFNAWLRIGGNPNSPTAARELFRWPFTQQYLNHLAETLQVTDVLKPAEVVFGLKREANYHGEDASHSARVAAWGKLGRIAKLEVVVSENNHTHRGGVMAIPMKPKDVDDWQGEVIDVQAKLKEDVKQ